MTTKQCVGYTSGGFEHFNIGQLNFLKTAKSQCDRLIVGVWTDEAASEKWQRGVEVPFEERAEIVRNLSCVDEVVIAEISDDEQAMWKRYQFDMLFVGEESKRSGLWDNFERKHNVHVVGIPRTVAKAAKEVLKSVDYMRFSPKFVVSNPRFDAYFAKNHDRLDELKSRLAFGMDHVSQALIERFISYHQIVTKIFPVNCAERMSCKERIKIPIYFDDAERKEWDRIDRDYMRNTTLPDWVWPEEVIDSSSCLRKVLRERLEKLYSVKRSLCFIDPSHWKVEGYDILDCGANIGDSSLIFEDLSPRSVHAFEPGAKIYENLKRVIAANHKEKTIIPVNRATSDHNGKIRFFIDENNDGASSTVFDDEKNTCEVECVTIDDYVQKSDLKIGVIKMDIEGAEYDSIVGATETIKKFKPNLIISVYHTPKDFFEIKPYLESLDLGYNFILRQLPQFRHSSSENELIAWTE